MDDLLKASNSLMEAIFADDTNLFLSHKNTGTTFASMDMELENFSTWFNSNKLSLNVDKPKKLLFHPLSKRQLLPQTLPNLLLEHMHIKREHVTKCLGEFIDENLYWIQHINIVSSKISKGIDSLYKSKDALSKQCVKQLYFLFIHNYVNWVNIA